MFDCSSVFYVSNNCDGNSFAVVRADDNVSCSGLLGKNDSAGGKVLSIVGVAVEVHKIHKIV
jgi:hypothetical protein